MTNKRREDILSQEALSNKDLCELYDFSAPSASRVIAEIKRKVGDRLGIKGKVHILDYMEWLEIKNEKHLERYINSNSLGPANAS